MYVLSTKVLRTYLLLAYVRYFTPENLINWSGLTHIRH